MARDGSMIGEGLSSSNGRRQLFCMARVISDACEGVFDRKLIVEGIHFF
jgi:hypothetical protein